MALSTNLVAGLASGFDWRSMIDQLIAVEHRTVDLVENKKATYESKLAAWQSFNTKLLSLKTAAESLKTPKEFYLYTSSMSTDDSTIKATDLLSVSAGATASPGTYSVKVTNLAQAQKLSSNPFAGKLEELGSSYAGEMVINGKVLTINATDSLEDVVSSINSLNTGTNPAKVTASVVNYGTNDYRLILTSDSTGEEGISLLNGASSDLVQKFGWKDNEAAAIKNSITNGAQSDRFTRANESIKTLLGLSTGESGIVTIGDQTVTINLTTMSLNDIRDAINNAAPTGVTASVISQTDEGATYYRLQIDGTQTFSDAGNILNTLGLLDHNSADVTGKVSGNSMTSEGAYITSTTLLKNIDGYNTFTAGGNPAGDYITLTGTDTAGVDIGSVNFDIASSTTVQDLLDAIETAYDGGSGEVLAYVTSDGKIRVDDLTGGANLAVTLTDHIANANSSLEFVAGDAAFSSASSRKRELIAGEDATVEVDGVQITSTDNAIDDVIGGVTLNLVKADSATTVTLNIQRDMEAIKGKIEDFVEKFNEVVTYINAQFTYDADKGTTGGLLFGDGTLHSVKSDLTTLLTQTIWGVNSNFSILGLVGINMDNNSLLSINDSKLTGYLQTNFSDVMALFVGQGVSSSSNLSYLGYSRNAQAGQYTVHINRAATRGTETGTVDLSGGGADETLTITQGNKAATITVTNGMALNDIINEINTELDTEYAETVVGDQQLYSDSTQTNVITSETTWDSIYNSVGTSAALQNGDVISFSGTARNGTSVSGSYTISDISLEKVKDFLSAVESAFSSKVTASVDTAGRIVLTDKYTGYSQLSLDVTEPAARQLDFGSVDITSGAGDGSQEGRYALSITATDDGSNHLVLRNDDYGSTSFTISQDISDNNYDHILYTDTSNTTASTNGTVSITASATWNDIYGAGVVNSDTITITGKARNGITDISGTYTINDIAADTVNGLLTDIENAYSAQGTIVDAFIYEGKIYVEDTTTGSSSISLTLTANNEGGGTLSLGTFDQSTERDVDLGLINGTVTGQDVNGTINGEAATGSSQILIGNSGNVNTEGLSVRYKGTSNAADAGTITLTLGAAELFDRTLFNITDLYSGYAAFKQDSLQNSIDRFATQIEQMEARLTRKMEMMINRFVAMEKAISKIQSQSNWLTGQINAASNLWSMK